MEQPTEGYIPEDFYLQDSLSLPVGFTMVTFYFGYRGHFKSEYSLLTILSEYAGQEMWHSPCIRLLEFHGIGFIYSSS
jgi:hypothetical protein